MSSASYPEAGKILQTFFAHRTDPRQVELDSLTEHFGIPARGIIYDFDGTLSPLVLLRVARSGRTFEFTDDPEIRPACAIVARDRWGEVQDIVAWSPRNDWAGTWLGRAGLLGENELQMPRGDEPLRVHLDVASWLRAERAGVVILDRRRARHELDGVRMAAASVEDGLTLRKILAAPEPRILVPQRVIERAAA